jgi:hypothetical protein
VANEGIELMGGEVGDADVADSVALEQFLHCVPCLEALCKSGDDE